MTESRGLMYLAIVLCLAVAWGGYAFFAFSNGVERKRRCFPYYMHSVSLLFLLIPLASGSWWAVTLASPFVVLVDQMWVHQVRFCSRCGTYHPARGWSGAATRCRRCGNPLQPDDGASAPTNPRAAT
jgi:ribosomal protein L40E